MQGLRDLLAENLELQSLFIIDRFALLINEIVVEQDKAKEIIEINFDKVANAQPPLGIYALIDYVHFKGIGTSDNETYKGQGWGLKQVLQGMNNNQPPLESFVESARQTLKVRVENAPPNRKENRWLKGWYNRLDTYLPQKEQQTDL